MAVPILDHMRELRRAAYEKGKSAGQANTYFHMSVEEDYIRTYECLARVSEELHRSGDFCGLPRDLQESISRILEEDANVGTGTALQGSDSVPSADPAV